MKIEHRIHIEAPLELVWAVTEKVEAWPDWTPTVTAARALTDKVFGTGGRYALKQPMQTEAVWEVTGCAPGAGFTWAKQGGGMRASHRLKPSAGGTTNTLELEVTGFLFALLWPVSRPVLTRVLKTENEALKAVCEARVGEGMAKKCRLESAEKTRARGASTGGAPPCCDAAGSDASAPTWSWLHHGAARFGRV